MSEISCEIIKDLLPSYVDGICSVQTVELVEGHLENCAECRGTAEHMKSTDMGGCFEENGEDLEHIDYMKKLKQHILNKSLFSFGILFLLVVVGMVMVLYKGGSVSVYWYYFSGPILLVAAYVLLADHTVESRAAKWKLRIGIIGGGSIVYMGILENWMLHVIRTGRFPKGMAQADIGPFVYSQFVMVALLCAVLFIVAISMSIRTGNRCSFVLVLSCMGGCAALTFISLLKRMDEKENFFGLRNRVLGVILLEGIVFLFLFWMIERRKRKEKMIY